jgi:hypothetical protein
MSTEKETPQPSTANLCEVWTKEITEEIRQTLGKLVNEEIVCVAIIDKNNSMEVLTTHPVKMMKEEPSGDGNPSDGSYPSSVGDPAIAWEITPEGCLWMITPVSAVQNGVWIENSRVCIYDSNKPACPVGQMR